MVCVTKSFSRSTSLSLFLINISYVNLKALRKLRTYKSKVKFKPTSVTHSSNIYIIISEEAKQLET